MKVDYESIAHIYYPPGYLIKYRKNLSGLFHFDRPLMEVPRPRNIDSLYVYLHECAHYHLNHGDKKKPIYLIEYEAEKWAHDKMRKHGLKIPISITEEARRYVKIKVIRALKRGLKKVDFRVQKFIDGSWSL